MRRHLQTLLLLPPLVLLGCGTGVILPPPSNPLLEPLAGNWQMQVQSSVTLPSITSFNLLGELSVSGSTVSGLFQLPSDGFFRSLAPCSAGSPQLLNFSGSVSANGLLSLTSAPFSGSVATLQLQLPSKIHEDDAWTAQGTVEIAGGACAYPPTPVLGVHVPPLNGTYTGTFTLEQSNLSNAGQAVPATIAFTQSVANAQGQFPLSANISINATSCSFSATITGIITGLDVTMLPGNPGYSSTTPSASLLGGGPLSTTQTTGPILSVGSSTTCPQGSYHGSIFTLQ